MQHVTQHSQFFPSNLIYGFLGKHPDIAVHKYRDYKDALNNRNKLLNSLLKSLKGNHSCISLLKQVHGINCVEIKTPEDINYDLEGDAQITKSPEVILALHTADCTPLLFVDQTEGIIAAAHAGWKGALNGVINSTLNAMKKAGASISNIITIIGPCIKQDSYEVSEDFIDQFLLENTENSKFFKKSKINKEKLLFNLPGYVKHKLAQTPIKKVYDTEIDTLSNSNFFSYRRACLANKKLKGYNLSFIGLK